MMKRTLELLRAAEQNLKDARDALHDVADVFPADLSSVVAEVRRSAGGSTRSSV